MSVKFIKANMDDGMNPELLFGARYHGYIGIPVIEKPKKFIVPTDIIPYTRRKECTDPYAAIGFYEQDGYFAELLRNPNVYVEEMKNRLLSNSKCLNIVLTPDCSLYRNAPLAVQITNIYRNRAIGYYLQKHGAYVIPQIRWGNELTYTNILLPEKVAFLGVEKHSIVAVGNYGCFQSKEDKYHFDAGLAAMLEELEPKIVLVYGSDNEKFFKPYLADTEFHFYPDYITRKKRGDK